MNNVSAFEAFGLKLKKKINIVHPKFNVDSDKESATVYHDDEIIFRIVRKQKAYWTFSGDNGTKCECIDEAFDMAFKTCKLYTFLNGV
jgi:hypothetical protein